MPEHSAGRPISVDIATAAVVAAILALLCLVPLSPLKAVAGIGLCLAVAFIAERITLALGQRDLAVRLGVASLSVIVVLMVTGFFLSITRLGIRPNTVGIVIALLAVVVAIPFCLVGRGAPRMGRARVHKGVATLSGAAVLILAAALCASIVSARHFADSIHYTVLSARVVAHTRVAAFVENHDAGPRRFRVVLMQGRSTIRSRTLEIGSGHSATVVAIPRSGQPVDAVLYRAGRSTALHRVRINLVTS